MADRGGFAAAGIELLKHWDFKHRIEIDSEFPNKDWKAFDDFLKVIKA